MRSQLAFNLSSMVLSLLLEALPSPPPLSLSVVKRYSEKRRHHMHASHTCCHGRGCCVVSFPFLSKLSFLTHSRCSLTYEHSLPFENAGFFFFFTRVGPYVNVPSVALRSTSGHAQWSSQGFMHLSTVSSRAMVLHWQACSDGTFLVPLIRR